MVPLHVLCSAINSKLIFLKYENKIMIIGLTIEEGWGGCQTHVHMNYTYIYVKNMNIRITI